MKRTRLGLGLWVLLVGFVLAPVVQGAEPVKFHVIEDIVYGHKDGLGLTLDVLTPASQPKS